MFSQPKCGVYLTQRVYGIEHLTMIPWATISIANAMYGTHRRAVNGYPKSKLNQELVSPYMDTPHLAFFSVREVEYRCFAVYINPSELQLIIFNRSFHGFEGITGITYPDVHPERQQEWSRSIMTYHRITRQPNGNLAATSLDSLHPASLFNYSPNIPVTRKSPTPWN